MIRTAKVIFCDEEHGCGNITFPELGDLSDADLISPKSTRKLRAEAKQAGWKRRKGNDLCPICVDCAEGG